MVMVDGIASRSDKQLFIQHICIHARHIFNLRFVFTTGKASLKVPAVQHSPLMGAAIPQHIILRAI